jgi:acetamidase/formamidase
MVSRHSLGRQTFHYLWNRDHKPALRIRPGDEVSFDINDVWSWEITRKTTSADLMKLDSSKLYPLAGPVYVEGAEPGDTLTVEVKEVETDDFGWSTILPGFGLLEEFNEPYLYKWDLKDRNHAPFVNGIRVPTRPFCGVMGVAPSGAGSFEVMPPGRHGGNMDIKHLTAGSRLELPVWVDGALFSTGDVHAAMGDGEVCVTAIECAGKATFRFGLVKRTGLAWPRYTSKLDPERGREYHVTAGIAPELMEAARASVRNMIDYLTREHGLKREDAYILCSVAVDLRIHEVVDKPNWVVGASIPMDIFLRKRK